MTDTTRTIKLPGQTPVLIARRLFSHHPFHNPAVEHSRPPTRRSLLPIKVVCISDTHNKQPKLPTGDILIHSGDLTENGSFDEFQIQLDWLSAQPHPHKILVAGNHDVVLDAAFLEKHPERKYGQPKTAADINWGDVKYLQGTSIDLRIPPPTTSSSKVSGDQSRTVKIFGGPWTPRYGISAFQYPREEDIWSNKIPDDTDIVVTHGPPRLYLDTQGVHKAGCVFLTQEIHRVRPALHVFGHIHVSYGQRRVVMDRARRRYDDVVNQWAGYPAVAVLAFDVLAAKLWVLIVGMKKVMASKKMTTFVNASVVGGPSNELRNDPIVITL